MNNLWGESDDEPLPAWMDPKTYRNGKQPITKSRQTLEEFSQFVYYDDADGKIIGSVYKVGNSQSIYGASVDNNVLGHYIDCDFARRAVEQYWNIQDKTLLE